VKLDWGLIATILITVIIGSFVARHLERVIGVDIPGL